MWAGILVGILVGSRSIGIVQNTQIEQFDGDLLLVERIDGKVHRTGCTGAEFTHDFVFADIFHFLIVQLKDPNSAYFAVRCPSGSTFKLL